MNELDLTLISTLQETTRSKFRGVFAADELTSIHDTSGPCYVIVNTSIRTDIGEHWICLYIPKKGLWEYFDSLAEPPGVHLANFMNTKSVEYLSCADRIQAFDTSTCGLYCLDFSYYRCIGISFQDYLSFFNSVNLESNEKVIKNRWCSVLRSLGRVVCLT